MILILILLVIAIVCLVIGIKGVKKQRAEKKEINSSATRPAPTENTYEFPVAGIGYRLDAVMGFAEEDDDYKLSAKKLAESNFGEKVYRYWFPKLPCSVEPEPDNPVDPNALKVLADGVPVGYIAHKDNEKARRLLSGDLGEVTSCKITFEGGEFKEPNLDDEDNWYVEKGEDYIFGTITFKVIPRDPGDLTDVILTPKDIAVE